MRRRKRCSPRAGKQFHSVNNASRLEGILANLGVVAEGVDSCRSTVALAERYGVEMPVCRAVHRVLFEGQDPREAVVQLMTRELRFEGE